MKPHRTDNVSLSFGLIFLLIAAWWAISQVINLAPVRLGWLIAGTLILFGMVGLLGAIRSGRKEQPAPVAATVGAPVETPGDLPPEMHAEIVRELLDDPAERFTRQHPAPQAQHPAPEAQHPAPEAHRPVPEAPRPAPEAEPRKD